MVNILYVQAYVKDEEVKQQLFKFYSQIKEGEIKGLERVQSILEKKTLNQLLEGLPHEFQDAVRQHPFEGAGIWTEWSDTGGIDVFYGSPLHRQFSEYAKGTLDKAWYRIVQLREEHTSARDIR